MLFPLHSRIYVIPADFQVDPVDEEGLIKKNSYLLLSFEKCQFKTP